MNYIDYIIIATYLIGFLFLGYLFKKNKSSNDYFLGAERNKGKRKKKLSFKEIIDFLDIEKILPKYPHEISAGEAQTGVGGFCFFGGG